MLLTQTFYLFYFFPVFSVIEKLLVKIETEGATGILKTPNWFTKMVPSCHADNHQNTIFHPKKCLYNQLLAKPIH